MNNLLKLSMVAILFIANSCSFANKSTVTVPMNSNPPGARIVIDGESYGKTPAFVSLKPNKNYKATFSKQGYESATVDMETWYSMRGGKSADGARCMADVASFILPYFIVLLFASEKCGSFKQTDYFADLPKSQIVVPKNNPNSGFSPKNPYQNYYGNQSPYYDGSSGVNQYQNSYYQQYQKQPDSYQDPNQEFHNQYKTPIPRQNQNTSERTW
ncbi:MAG: hypothetical protein ACJA02_000207 [Myxococcota bacterium]|jgi:hypothetical protein